MTESSTPWRLSTHRLGRPWTDTGIFLRNIIQDPVFQGVFFIAKDEDLLRSVRNLEASLTRPEAAKMYYSSYDTCASTGEAVFTTIDGKTIRISPVPVVPPGYHVELGENLEEDAKC